MLAPPTRSAYGASSTGSVTFRQAPIAEQELLKVFCVTGGPTPSCTTQLLLLYYILLYHNTWLGNLKAYSTHLKTPPPTYSPHLLGSVPVKWLLQQARRRQSNYAVLYPSLVKLVVTHLPHVAMATSGLDESRTVLALKSSDKFTPERVEGGMCMWEGGREGERVEGGMCMWVGGREGEGVEGGMCTWEGGREGGREGEGVYVGGREGGRGCGGREGGRGCGGRYVYEGGRERVWREGGRERMWKEVCV